MAGANFLSHNKSLDFLHQQQNDSQRYMHCTWSRGLKTFFSSYLPCYYTPRIVFFEKGWGDFW
jgi:hypothetical protein